MSSRLRLWLLLGVSVLFVVTGLVVAALGDWRLGLGNTIFFGLAAAVFAYQLRELSRFGGPAQLLTLRGGLPLQISPQRRAFFTVVVFGAGVSSVLIGFQRNQPLYWLGVLTRCRWLRVRGRLRLCSHPGHSRRTARIRAHREVARVTAGGTPDNWFPRAAWLP